MFSKKVSLGGLFLDSGAHSLYTKYVIDKRHKDGYAYYKSREFWDYVNQYAAFVYEHKDSLDYYANVDVIFNPEISWQVLKYLEKKGLRPVPVIHYGTDLKWIEKHIAEGYDLLGLGGLGQEVTSNQYYDWADRVFSYLCPPPDYRPIVKTHGFAMTGFDLMRRYPWWSSDSSSWTKIGAYGNVLVPRKRNGKYTFEEKPDIFSFSKDSKRETTEGNCYYYDSNIFSPVNDQDLKTRETLEEWMEKIGIPIGETNSEGKELKEGAATNHSYRKAANLIFFEKFRLSLPPWPCCLPKDTRKDIEHNKRKEWSAATRDEGRWLGYQGKVKFADYTGPKILWYSGEENRALPEYTLDKANVMLTYWLHGQGNSPSKRFQRLLGTKLEGTDLCHELIENNSSSICSPARRDSLLNP